MKCLSNEVPAHVVSMDKRTRYSCKQCDALLQMLQSSAAECGCSWRCLCIFQPMQFQQSGTSMKGTAR